MVALLYSLYIAWGVFAYVDDISCRKINIYFERFHPEPGKSSTKSELRLFLDQLVLDRDRTCRVPEGEVILVIIMKSFFYGPQSFDN